MNFIQKYRLYKEIIKRKPSKVTKITGAFFYYTVDMYDVSCVYDEKTDEYTVYVEFPKNIVDFYGILGRILFRRTRRYL